MRSAVTAETSGEHAESPGTRSGLTGWRRFARRWLRSPAFVIGGTVLAIILAAVLLGPLLIGGDATAQNLMLAQEPPSLAHPLGYDHLGRDMLARVMYGGRLSLGASAIATLIGFVAGVPLGIVAGLGGSIVDDAIMRTIDVLWSFPSLLLAMFVSTALGPGVWNTAVAVGIAMIPEFARLVRAATRVVRAQPYLESAYAVGHGYSGIVFRYVLPNIVYMVMVHAIFRFGTTILTVASLSFIGLGAQPPSPEWGQMIAEGRTYIFTAPHVIYGPGLVVAGVVFSLNVLADSLRERLDPQLRGKIG